jgi:hypothetical protein
MIYDVERTNRGLVAAFSWKAWGRLRKTSVSIAGPRPEIWTGNYRIRSRSANHSTATFSGPGWNPAWGMYVCAWFYRHESSYWAPQYAACGSLSYASHLLLRLSSWFIRHHYPFTVRSFHLFSGLAKRIFPFINISRYILIIWLLDPLWIWSPHSVTTQKTNIDTLVFDYCHPSL